jgi:protein gp37
MGANSRIAWCDATWNPLRGCSRVSLGCQNCYAERMCARGLPGLRSPVTGMDFAVTTFEGPRWVGFPELIESQVPLPMRWRKPRRIFVNSMSDTFHERVLDGWIRSIFDTMRKAGQHSFIVCTKRIQRARKVMPLMPLPNVILLASVEDQQRADERIPDLLATPAAVRGISLEPMLGAVEISRYLRPHWTPGKGADPPPWLDWVIVGGESGPGARPCRLEWIRDVVRQCREARVACFVKQLGSAWANEGQRYDWKPRGAWSPAGSDPAEWPEDLRVRQWPKVAR